MLFDFHTHGKLAKKLPFSTAYTDWLFGEARRAGLDGLCLTEHFNTLQFEDLYGYLASVSQHTGDCLVMENGLRVFPGMETDVAECGHILSIGPMEAILELNRRLAPHKERGHFPPLAQLLDLFEEYPVLVGCGHPYRAPGHVPEQPLEQLRRFAFLDMNGKDMAMDPERTRALTTQLGKTLGIPVVSGSDTHQAVQYGCIATRFEREFTTVEQLRQEMNAGRYSIELSEQASFLVRTAGLLKRSLKEIHALGGDYVEVLTSQAPV